MTDLIPSSVSAWWRQSTNPECLPWCEVTHDDQEFASMAWLVCSRRFGPYIDVDVTQSAADDDMPGVLVIEPAAVSVTQEAPDMDPDTARALACQLELAAAFVEGERCRAARAFD